MNQTICIAGKNSIAVAGLRYVLEAYPNNKILFLPNSTDDGQNGWQPSFKRFGRSTAATEVRLSDIYSESDLIFISLEFSEIIKPDLFKSKNLFNIHFSFLPKYKGMYTSVLPLLHGETKSGVTIHKIDDGIDTGEIIDQIEFEIDLKDTAKDLYLKYLRHGEQLFLENIENLISATYDSNPQKFYGSTYFSKKSLDFSNVLLDLRSTAFQILNQFRAFNFRDYQLPTFGGWEIFGTEILDTKSKLKPGSLIKESDDLFIVSSIDYDVVLFKDYYKILWDSAKKDDIEKLCLALKKIRSIDASNKQGWNALILASFAGSISSVELLLAHGANPSATNYKGTTVLMYAFSNYEKSCDSSIFKMLLKAGAATDAKDDFGKSLKDYMVERNNIDLLELVN